MKYKAKGITGVTGSQTIVKRFLKYVADPGEGCWLWTGAKNVNKDGAARAQFRTAGKAQSASRAAYALFVGDLPRGALVLHSCDNGMCVAPHHLRIGTHRENTADMVKRGRSNKGKKFPGLGLGCKRRFGARKRKLSDKDVLDIRRRRESGEALAYVAKKYRISAAHCSLIARGLRKGHVQSR